MSTQRATATGAACAPPGVRPLAAAPRSPVPQEPIA